MKGHSEQKLQLIVKTKSSTTCKTAGTSRQDRCTHGCFAKWLTGVKRDRECSAETHDNQQQCQALREMMDAAVYEQECRSIVQD